MCRCQSMLSWVKSLASLAVVIVVCIIAANLSPALAKRDRPIIGTERNWKVAPAIVEVDTLEDLHALGDVHGDYDRLVTLLVAGKMIEARPDRPENVRWAANKSILINTGDLIDKGGHSIEVLTLFRALTKEAAKAGGRVIVTMGNHEAEFLIDSNNSKAVAFIEELEKAGIKPSDVSTGQDKLGLGTFLNSLPVAARVNDWFFAHAGNTQGLTLKKLRSTIEKDVAKKGYKAHVLLGEKGLLSASLGIKPWWETKEDPGNGEKHLRANLDALGVKHLVIGHQPGNIHFEDGPSRAKGVPFTKYNGMIFLNDLGMSEAVDHSHGALLYIQTSKKGRVVAIYPNKAAEVLWPGA